MAKFADDWAFCTTNLDKSIQCHFSKPTYKSTGDQVRNGCSIKRDIKCPFRVNYKVLSKPKKDPLPKFY